MTEQNHLMEVCCCDCGQDSQKSMMRPDEQWQKNRQAVAHRLSRAAGHLEAVKEMLEEGRDCAEVLIQLAAVRSAVNNAGKALLQNHIQHCVVHAIETRDQKVLDELAKAIDQFMK